MCCVDGYCRSNRLVHRLLGYCYPIPYEENENSQCKIVVLMVVLLTLLTSNVGQRHGLLLRTSQKDVSHGIVECHEA